MKQLGLAAVGSYKPELQPPDVISIRSLPMTYSSLFEELFSIR